MIKVNQLQNGIVLITEPMEQYRSVSVGIWIKVGSAYEKPEHNGVSHLIEHMLFKGTKNRTAEQIANEAALMGGDMSAYTSKETTCYYIHTIDDNLEQAVDILSDMLLHPVFDENELIKEKNVILDEIDMYEDSPEELIHDLLHQSIWDKHPLGYMISGTKESVQRLTTEHMREYMSQYYTGENMFISIAGHFDEAMATKWVEKYFNETNRGQSPVMYHKPVYQKALLKKTKDIEQVHMNIVYEGLVGDLKTEYTSEIVSYILGEGYNSRLFQYIREEKGLAYSISSYHTLHTHAGVLQICGAMNPEHVNPVLEGVQHVIDDLSQNGVEDDELYRAKRELTTELILAEEATKNRMFRNGEIMVYRNTILSLQDIMEHIETISLDDVNDYMRQVFRHERKTVAILGRV